MLCPCPEVVPRARLCLSTTLFFLCAELDRSTNLCSLAPLTILDSKKDVLWLFCDSVNTKSHSFRVFGGSEIPKKINNVIYHCARNHFIESQMREGFRCDWFVTSLYIFFWTQLIILLLQIKKKKKILHMRCFLQLNTSPFFSLFWRGGGKSDFPNSPPRHLAKVPHGARQQCTGTPGWEHDAGSFTSAFPDHQCHPSIPSIPSTASPSQPWGNAAASQRSQARMLQEPLCLPNLLSDKQEIHINLITSVL